MRAVIQRVAKAEVEINGIVTASIEKGLCVLLGIEADDTVEDARWLAEKIINMRIFGDHGGKMNLSLKEVSGRLLVVSQFTLHAQTRKGNRPSFIRAAAPETAVPLYEKFIGITEELTGEKTQTGTFGAMMDISLVNSGPVTIIIDSKNKE